MVRSTSGSRSSGMSILTQTVLISLLMALCFTAPRFSKKIASHSKILLLIGTGGLVSLYFADLLPDVLELGGLSSLAIIVAVWLTYSYFHTSHVHDHAHSHEGHAHEDLSHLHVHGSGSPKFLMISMVSHCFSSGMLLYMSHELSSRIAASVFFALIGHKGYEALSVSVLLSQKIKDARKFTLCALGYSLAFPVGVLTTAALARFLGDGASPVVIKTVATIVASVAVGSLAGCMVNDFLLPSIRHVKSRRLEAGWMLVGVALTMIFVVGVPG
jgi:zinc transporter ZupT